MKSTSVNKVSVWGWHYSPYSTDPIEYDDTVHHLAWTSVFGTLVSTYKVGEIAGQIAESWKSSDDYRSWSFKINPACKFETGERITPEVVSMSLKRIALLQKRKRSQSGLFEDLLALDRLEKPTSEFEGITFDENSVHLKFTKPKKDLLGKIGFGLYAIVHPSQFNSEGDWIDKKIAISSGAYKVTNWTEDTLDLKINEYQKNCLRFLENPIDDISIAFGQKKLDIEKQQIISGSSKSLMVDETFDFLGPVDSDILYIRVYKKLDLNISKILRDVIVTEMKSLKGINFEMNQSFLPLGVKGIERAQISNKSSEELDLLKGISIVVPAYEPSRKADKMASYLSFTDAFTSVMNLLKSKYQMDIKFAPLDYAEVAGKSSPFDMELLLTGVIVENPFEDVRFMFKSTEGIQLPDLDGSIDPLLSDVEGNLKEINDKIWDQGLIIPVTHYSSGLWVKKGILDTKKLNHLLPATNFQFIGMDR